MDWWSNPWAISFMFAVAFFVMLKEWFVAHDIIDRLRDKYKDDLNSAKAAHFWEVNELEAEIKDYKRRLGIND